jgi:hypothetical protein
VYGNTRKIMDPFIMAMTLEGSYNMRPPCYNSELINPPDPKCTKGSLWAERAQEIMAGPMPENISIESNDNFHRVYSANPVHLPEISNLCNSTVTCTVKSISVTENTYAVLDDIDSGYGPVAAIDMKAKLMSRQSM